MLKNLVFFFFFLSFFFERSGWALQIENANNGATFACVENETTRYDRGELLVCSGSNVTCPGGEWSQTTSSTDGVLDITYLCKIEDSPPTTAVGSDTAVPEEVVPEVVASEAKPISAEAQAKAKADLKKIESKMVFYLQTKNWVLETIGIEQKSAASARPQEGSGAAGLAAEESVCAQYSSDANQLHQCLLNGPFYAANCSRDGDCQMREGSPFGARSALDLGAEMFKENLESELSLGGKSKKEGAEDSTDYQACVTIYGDRIEEKLKEQKKYYDSAFMPASVLKTFEKGKRDLNDLDNPLAKIESELTTLIGDYNGKITGTSLPQLSADELFIKSSNSNNDVMNGLLDRVRMGYAQEAMRTVRECEAMFYLTHHDTEIEAEKEFKSSMTPYGQIPCKNTSPYLTQDFQACIKVAKAVDGLYIAEVAASEASKIAGQTIQITGQAKAMQTASVNPTDPTLALFELKKQTEGAAVSAYTVGGLQGLMALNMAAAAGNKFPTLSDFVEDCETGLSGESGIHSYGARFLVDILPPGSNPSSIRSAKMTEYNPKEETKTKVVESLPSWERKLFAGLSQWFWESTGRLAVMVPTFNKVLMAAGAEDKAAKEAALQADAEKRQYEEYQKATGSTYQPLDAKFPVPSGQAAQDKEKGAVSSGSNTPDDVYYYYLQVADRSACSVAAEKVGYSVLAPNEAVKQAAQSIATQAGAKSLVSLAAGAAYTAQVINIQKMIDDINNKMEGLDMGGIAADLLTIQECQLNPSLTQCGGLGFADGSVGFESGFGSISMETGSSTMGNAAASDSDSSSDSDSTSDSGESLSATGAYDSFAGTDADEAAASRAGIKDATGGGGTGGGSGNSPGSPGGSGASSPGSGGSGNAGGSFGRSLGGGYLAGSGSSYGSGTGKKSSNSLDEAMKAQARAGSVLDYRGPAGIGDSSTSIWERISKGYQKANTNKRLLIYVEE